MQKKLTIATLFVLISVTGTFCKKELLPTYSTSDSIYFGMAYTYTGVDLSYNSSEITFAFARAAVTDSVVKIRVNVTGSPSIQDRPYKIVVDTSSTAVEGKHYEALPASFILPAGKVFDSIAVKLFRSADLKQDTVRLVLKVQPNEYFTTNITSALGDQGTVVSALTYSIQLSDILIQPTYWVGTSLGKFSGKKMELICELGNIEPSFFMYGDASTEPGTVDFTIKVAYLAQLLKRYLLEQKIAGTPVYYEDGVTEMATDDYQ